LVYLGETSNVVSSVKNDLVKKAMLFSTVIPDVRNVVTFFLATHSASFSSISSFSMKTPLFRLFFENYPLFPLFFSKTEVEREKT
jgi:hypothetical protein